MSVAAAFDPKAFVRTLGTGPGVYQMLDAEGVALYIGKARQLRHRVGSYFQSHGLETRTMRMLSRVCSIQVTVTASETEALLLEQNLIKRHRPRYNILLRDDKSYPYLYLSEGQYPRISMRRTRRSKRVAGRYFGPYPSASELRHNLNFLHRAFQLRQCTDSVFHHRTRPCLQYQIGRCTAPCVGLISERGYAGDVRDAVLFLEGGGQALQGQLADRMEQASKDLAFERAAALRDRIAALRRMRERQSVDSTRSGGDADVVALVEEGGMHCAQWLQVRDGHVSSSHSYFPQLPLSDGATSLLSAFVPHLYLGGGGREIPRELLLSAEPDNASLLAAALGRAAGKRVRISSPKRGLRGRWLQLALNTAWENLRGFASGGQRLGHQREALAKALGCSATPERIEAFDVSHGGGRHTVASCVVAGVDGLRPAEYRRFNIRDAAPGDDLAALREALERRYLRGSRARSAQLPDLLLVDGGAAQLRAALAVLSQLAEDGACVEVVGISKGVSRRPGWEQLHRADGRSVALPPDSEALHLLQRLRDEAHRFAIAGQRRRQRRAAGSGLEHIAGIGPARRRSLLRHFGGLRALQRASREEIVRAPGMGDKLATTVCEALSEPARMADE